MTPLSSLDDSKRALALVYDALAVVLTYAAWWAAVVLIGDLAPHPAAPLNAIKAFKLDWPSWYVWATGGALTFGALAFGLNPFRRGGSYGGAHFATRKEIRKDLKLRDREGVILGIEGGQYLRTNEPLSVLIYAPPGSGKTAGIIIPSLLSCSNSALVHDPKGELYDKTAGFRAKSGHKVYRFEPAAEDSTGWNPLGKGELPDSWAAVLSHVDRIGTSIVMAGKSGDDYWTREARSVFTFFCLYLIHRDGETSLPDIREFALSKSDPQGFVAELLDSNPDLPQRIVEEANGILAKSGNEFSGVFGTFKSFMNSYGDPFIAANTRRSDFRLRDLREADTTVYLVIRNSDQTRLRPFATLFFELATLALIHEEPKPGERRVTFYLDEFVRLGNMREVVNMPAISRSFKVNILFVAQSMSQVVEIYGQAGADQLRNTCSYHVIFAQNEQKIAEDISKSIGSKTRKKITFSTPEKNLTRNTSESEEGIPLVLAQEVMSLPAFHILLLMQNHFETPVKAKAAAWFKDDNMKARIGLPIPGAALAVAPLSFASETQTRPVEEPLPAQVAAAPAAGLAPVAAAAADIGTFEVHSAPPEGSAARIFHDAGIAAPGFIHVPPGMTREQAYDSLGMKTPPTGNDTPHAAAPLPAATAAAADSSTHVADDDLLNFDV